MDLFVETSPRGGGRGGSGQQQPELEHYPHVSPHKVRRESHRYAQLPKSPVPRGAATADESTLRRITTNGGTVYETGNRVELSSGADEEWQARPKEERWGAHTSHDLAPAAAAAARRREFQPSSSSDDPHVQAQLDRERQGPVHLRLITEEGIMNLENMVFDTLVEDEVYEFLFVFTPIRFKGATGSPGRPIAIR